MRNGASCDARDARGEVFLVASSLTVGFAQWGTHFVTCVRHPACLLLKPCGVNRFDRFLLDASKNTKALKTNTVTYSDVVGAYI